MIIVMKGHTVVSTLNYETTSIKLSNLKDALTFTEILRKLAKRKCFESVPRNYLEVLHDHLKNTGKICCKSKKQTEQIERLKMLADLAVSIQRSIHA